ncbi:MAG: hypothetical protein ACFCGT_04440 [Sandaracinaceae bacterium]
MNHAFRTLGFGLSLIVGVGCGGTGDPPGDDQGPGSSQGGVTLSVGEITTVGSAGAIQPMRDLFLSVEVTVSAEGSVTTPVPVAPVQFSLVFSDRSARMATIVPTLDGGCLGDQTVLGGGSLTCLIFFDIEGESTFEAVAFLALDGTIEAPTPVTQAPGFAEGNRLLSELSETELADFCAEATDGFTTEGTRCFGDDVDRFPFIPEELANACGLLALPILGSDVRDRCFDYDASACTRFEYQSCLEAIAVDICEVDRA